MLFPLIRTCLSSNENLYFTITSSQLREILVTDMGYTQEQIKKYPKKRLWYMVTGKTRQRGKRRSKCH
jgi:hypothetical protein